VVKSSLRVTVTLKDFGQRPINGASILVDRTRSKQLQLPHQPKQAVFLRILLGHDFFIGKARLWLAERTKYRGSHGGAPETGFKVWGLQSKVLGFRDRGLGFRIQGSSGV